eukprot:g2846.t1
MFSFFDKKSTFKPKKQKNLKTATLRQKANIHIEEGNLRKAVKLPEGTELNDWLATHTLEFFNDISLLFSVISEFCTEEKFPKMTAGARFEYLWADGIKVKKPIKLSAPKYIDALFQWAEDLLNDETKFPSLTSSSYPANFQSLVKQIMKRFFRVYAHIYHHHERVITELKLKPHLNTCFKHFILFIQEFHLVAPKELAPLKDLIAKIDEETMVKQLKKTQFDSMHQ